MSELLVGRSLFRPRTERMVDVIDVDDTVLGEVALVRPEYRVWFEAITPNSKSDRRRLTREQGADIDVPSSRELLVEIDKKVLQRLQAWKPFQHYKGWYDTTPTNITRLKLRFAAWTPVYRFVHVDSIAADEMFLPLWFNATTGPVEGLEVWFDEDSDTGDYIALPEGLDELVSQSLSRLIPRIQTQVQLLNTLLELKDIVLLKRTINRIRTLGHEVTRKGLVGTLRDVARSAADVFLSYKFGIEPLIGDIQGIHKALVDSLGRLRRMMQLDGIPQVRRYRRDLREDKGTGYSTHSVAQGALEFEPELAYFGQNSIDLRVHVSAVDLYRSVSLIKDEFCAQLRFVARWTELQHRYAEQLGLIDALGLSWNPKHIWDAIPFSFIVDWVAKVGDFLDNYRKGALDPVLDVIDYSWSISREREIKLDAKVDGRVVSYPVFRESVYRRQPLEPDKHALVMSSLSSNEVRLASALVIAQRKKLRKPKNSGRRLPRRRRHLIHAK